MDGLPYRLLGLQGLCLSPPRLHQPHPVEANSTAESVTSHPAAILGRVDRSAVETQLRDYFSKQPQGVVAAYLFGSFGRATAGPASDVDVAVLYSTSLPSTLDSPVFTQEGDLERILGRPSQVIALNAAPADLVHRVLRDGRLVFEGNRSARIAFEVKSRNEYFDLLPFLRRYRKLERPA